MKIYNVIIHDRHFDIVIYTFSSVVTAINFARRQAHKFGSYFNEDGTLKEEGYSPEKDDGWILFIPTSCEGDYIRVSIGIIE